MRLYQGDTRKRRTLKRWLCLWDCVSEMILFTPFKLCRLTTFLRLCTFVPVSVSVAEFLDSRDFRKENVKLSFLIRWISVKLYFLIRCVWLFHRLTRSCRQCFPWLVHVLKGHTDNTLVSVSTLCKLLIVVSMCVCVCCFGVCVCVCVCWLVFCCCFVSCVCVCVGFLLLLLLLFCFLFRFYLGIRRANFHTLIGEVLHWVGHFHSTFFGPR